MGSFIIRNVNHPLYHYYCGSIALKLAFKPAIPLVQDDSNNAFAGLLVADLPTNVYTTYTDLR